MKIFTGKIVSDKMQKTAVVEVARMLTHPLYHKRVKRTKKFLVDNEKGAKMGDEVRIVETRPFSKNKYFEVKEVVKHAAA